MQIEIICVQGEVSQNKGLPDTPSALEPANLSIVEVADEQLLRRCPLEIEQVLDKEADRIEARLDAGRQVIVLAIEGDLISPEDLAQRLDRVSTWAKGEFL